MAEAISFSRDASRVRARARARAHACELSHAIEIGSDSTRLSRRVAFARRGTLACHGGHERRANSPVLSSPRAPAAASLSDVHASSFFSPEDDRASRLAPHALRVIECPRASAPRLGGRRRVRGPGRLHARKGLARRRRRRQRRRRRWTAAAVPQVPPAEVQYPQHPNVAAIVRRTVATRPGRTRESAPIPPATPTPIHEDAA